MKMLLILWILGIVKCDKLDRTYLPPLGSGAAGGYSGDLNLPSEFPKENYPSTLEPGSDVLTSDFSLTTTLPKYPNIVLGIDRKGPTTVDTLNFLNNRPRIPVTEKINNITTTVSSYDIAQTSTLSSVDTYYTTVEPITIYNERYPSTQLPNVQSVSTNLTPHRFSATHYEGNADHTSDIHHTNPKIHSIQQAPEKSNGFRKKSQDFYDLSQTGPPSISLPAKSIVEATELNTNVLPQRAQGDINAVILKYENILTPEGYTYSFDTSNGIHIDENGATIEGVKAKGSYSYTGDDGKLYSIEYTADENGFLPRGNHLPTAPPIPEAILRGVEQAEKNKKIGLIEDGSYDEAKYGHGKYQGLMDRIPSREYNSVTTNQPTIKGNLKQSKINNAFEKVRIPENKDDFFDTNNHKLNTPNKSEAVQVSYTTENDNRPNLNNLIRTENGNYKIKFVNVPRNEFNGRTRNASRINETSGKTSPTENNQNDKKLNNNSGYEYTQPQNVFDDNKRISPLRFSSIARKNKPSPDSKPQNEIMIVKHFTSPDTTINSKSRRPGPDSQILRDTLNDPIKSSGYTNPNVKVTNIGTTKPGLSTNYNRRTGPIKNGDSTATFTTLKSENAFTNAKPYNDLPSYTINENGKQNNTYPSFTLGPQYSMPTTSLPAKYLSPHTSYTNSLTDSQTTPIASLVSSTRRPSITSAQPTSEISSLPSGYQEQMSGLKEVAGSKSSPTNPNSPGQSIIGLTENMQSKSRPNNYGIPSSTVIGEDFSGPKQPQRFDPKYGYYY